MTQPVPLHPSYDWGFVVGRSISAMADTVADPDPSPEARGSNGRVTFTPHTRYKKKLDDPTAFVQFEVITARIENGNLVDAHGENGIYLISGAYKVAFTIDSGSVPGFDILVTPDHTPENPLDLVTASPFVPEVGTPVTTAIIPAGAAENQVLAWRNGRLVWIDGGDPGENGADSTVPGTPGQVLTPESMLVVGPGRPDAPTTTDMTSEALATLPVGCEYRSTDGASVGAWVWRKRPAGWVVTDGDTEWRTISDGTDAGVLGKGYTLALRRAGPVVEMRFYVNQNTSAMPDYALPSGFSAYAMDLQRAMYRGGSNPVAGNFRLSYSTLVYNGLQPTIRATALETWTTSDPWPTTLP